MLQGIFPTGDEACKGVENQRVARNFTISGSARTGPITAGWKDPLGRKLSLVLSREEAGWATLEQEKVRE